VRAVAPGEALPEIGRGERIILAGEVDVTVYEATKRPILEMLMLSMT
jgi:hypothetical protein